MKELGYPLTWPTHCFIRESCSKPVWAHTNGFGDFVLFDELGWPWPIHECYVDRFDVEQSFSRTARTILASNSREYKEIDDRARPSRPAGRDISRIEPADRLNDGTFSVVGYVLDYIENRAEKLGRERGNLGQSYLSKILGTRTSQITIITSGFESFTVFADLRNTIVQKRDMIVAQVRGARTIALGRITGIFLCDELTICRTR